MTLNSIKINNSDAIYTGVVYDISEATGESYTNLSDALGTNGNNVPESVRKGGMSIKFIQSTTHTYVQYRLTSQVFNTRKTSWESIEIQDDIIHDFSISDDNKNKILAVNNGHIYTKEFNSESTPTIIDSPYVSLSLSDESGFDIVQFNAGHIKTKNFDSENSPTTIDTSLVSLAISDENGNNIVQFSEGHIKTKNFDSRNITPSPSPSGDIPANIQYLPRPEKGKHCFSVNVNCNLFTLENSLTKQDQEIDGVDYGFVSLPENYTPTGEPTRLIIYCHGAGASLSSYQNPNAVNYSAHYECWLKLGFAFMDMYGAPTQFTGSTTEHHLGNPTVLQCYRKGYEYVQRHFNIKRDGIFVIGASMGGLSSLQICMSGMFPVIGYVGYCPVCDLYKQAYLGQWSSTNRQYIAKFFNFVGRDQVTFTSGHIGTAEERQIFKDNIELWKGFNPILMNADNELAQQLLSYVPSLDDSASWDAEENLAEAETYKDLKIDFPVPAKIFHCVDDTTVLFRYSKYLVNAIRRRGGRAWFRPLPSGGHGAWASGENVSVTDINGQSFTMKASTYEAYLFLKRLNN